MFDTLYRFVPFSKKMFLDIQKYFFNIFINNKYISRFLEYSQLYVNEFLTFVLHFLYQNLYTVIFMLFMVH